MNSALIGYAVAGFLMSLALAMLVIFFLGLIPWFKGNKEVLYSAGGASTLIVPALMASSGDVLVPLIAALLAACAVYFRYQFSQKPQ